MVEASLLTVCAECACADAAGALWVAGLAFLILQVHLLGALQQALVGRVEDVPAQAAQAVGALATAGQAGGSAGQAHSPRHIIALGLAY